MCVCASVCGCSGRLTRCICYMFKMICPICMHLLTPTHTPNAMQNNPTHLIHETYAFNHARQHKEPTAHTATHCSAPQHTATRCNALQHTPHRHSSPPAHSNYTFSCPKSQTPKTFIRVTRSGRIHTSDTIHARCPPSLSIHCPPHMACRAPRHSPTTQSVCHTLISTH